MEPIPTYWQSINLEDLNSKAAMQTRVDRKYVVDEDYAAAVLAELPADASVLEINGQREFVYDSVYFDTPNLTSYRATATDRRNRFKVRTRTYLDTGTAFLEVKTEGENNTTVKERIPYAPEHRNELTPEGLDYVAEALKNLTDAPATAFIPVLSTGYRRTTVYLPASTENPIDSRLTIDRELTWTPMSEHAFAGAKPEDRYGDEVGTTYTVPGMVIIETKSGNTPSVADKHLWRAGIRPVKVSKFGTGLAALNPRLPSNKWHRVIERWMNLKPLASASY